MANDQPRRSLNTLFRLGIDWSQKTWFVGTVLYRRKPRVGLGGPWRRETLTIYARDEHDARRMVTRTLLENGFFVKALVIEERQTAQEPHTTGDETTNAKENNMIKKSELLSIIEAAATKYEDDEQAIEEVMRQIETLPDSAELKADIVRAEGRKMILEAMEQREHKASKRPPA
jgi:hypothetical protein